MLLLRSFNDFPQGGDKLTLNLSGVVDVPPLISLSPNSPKTPASSKPIAPGSAAALITFNTPPASPIFDVSANTTATDAAASDNSSLLNNNHNNSNSNVTVTHFSDQRGGVVEKISVPSLNIYSAEMSSPKLDNQTRAKQSNNPFLNSSSLLANGASTNPFFGGLNESSDAANNNHNNTSETNGRSVSVAEDSEEDNLEVGHVKRLDKKVMDTNPFRDGDVLNGNHVQEIVAVSETDGGKATVDVIRVCLYGKLFVSHFVFIINFIK